MQKECPREENEKGKHPWEKGRLEEHRIRGPGSRPLEVATNREYCHSPRWMARCGESLSWLETARVLSHQQRVPIEDPVNILVEPVEQIEDFSVLVCQRVKLPIRPRLLIGVEP